MYVFSKSGKLYSLIGMSSNNAVKIIYWINYYVTASLAWQKLSVTIIFEMGMYFNSMIWLYYYTTMKLSKRLYFCFSLSLCMCLSMKKIPNICTNYDVVLPSWFHTALVQTIEIGDLRSKVKAKSQWRNFNFLFIIFFSVKFSSQ